MTTLQLTWELTPVGAGWDVEPDTVVWVNVAKVEASFVVGDQWVGPGVADQADTTPSGDIS
ncbi:hypothetical protein [Caulobacter sp. CCUG 60055]|uniref:hypothetical protein n=1 Tax=Caulobacter sp. CCUG 60055 TaxID=2100090 RepID=UPI001FA6FF32|nr:hypothetical protein [Caulobacter sp. CCUG 60055]MBQ1541410.1 hypothetical protein [Caulobacteraceae bacterium]